MLKSANHSMCLLLSIGWLMAAGMSAAAKGDTRKPPFEDLTATQTLEAARHLYEGVQRDPAREEKLISVLYYLDAYLEKTREPLNAHLVDNLLRWSEKTPELKQIVLVWLGGHYKTLLLNDLEQVYDMIEDRITSAPLGPKAISIRFLSNVLIRERNILDIATMESTSTLAIDWQTAEGKALSRNIISMRKRISAQGIEPLRKSASARAERLADLVETHMLSGTPAKDVHDYPRHMVSAIGNLYEDGFIPASRHDRILMGIVSRDCLASSTRVYAVRRLLENDKDGRNRLSLSQYVQTKPKGDPTIVEIAKMLQMRQP